MAVIPEQGQVFSGRYLLLAPLGAGGIGTVFKATQLDCDRLVALKIIHSEVAADDDMVKRFIKEARALNELHHENIVNVYHVGLSDDGLPYIAMELIEGKSIRQLLYSEKKLPVLRAIKICKQVANALAFIHSRDIIHRDIKPENIVTVDLPEADTAKIIDFGLARFLQEQRSTKTGALIGSPVYMSPEQCMGRAVERSSDIYSLSVCFYEMITGRTPFEADNAIGFMYKHLNETAPAIGPGNVDRFHPKINEFFSAGLAKSPEQRFKSMQELAAALEELEQVLLSSGNSTVGASALVASKQAGGPAIAKKYLLALSGLVVVVLVILLSLFYLNRQHKKVEDERIASKPLVSADEISRLISKGPACIEYGRHKVHRKEFLAALNNWESAHRNLSPKIKANLNALRATICADYDRIEEAEAYAKIANMWKLSPEYFMPLTLSLAEMYGRSSRYDKSLNLLHRAEKCVPPESNNHAMLLRTEGETYWDLKKYDECLNAYKQAEKIWLELTGECGPDVNGIKLRIVRPLYLKGDMKAVHDYVESDLKCLCVSNSISRTEFEAIVSSSKSDTQPSMQDKKISENIANDLGTLAQSFADVRDLKLTSKYLQMCRNALLKVNEESNAYEKIFSVVRVFRAGDEYSDCIKIEKESEPFFKDPETKFLLLGQMAIDSEKARDYKLRFDSIQRAFFILDRLVLKDINIFRQNVIADTLSGLVDQAHKEKLQGRSSDLESYLSKWETLGEQGKLPVEQQTFLLQLRLQNLVYQEKYVEALPLLDKVLNTINREDFRKFARESDQDLNSTLAFTNMSKQAVLHELKKDSESNSVALDVIAYASKMRDTRAAGGILGSLAQGMQKRNELEIVKKCMEVQEANLEKVSTSWDLQQAQMVADTYRLAKKHQEALRFERKWLNHASDDLEKARIYYFLGSDLAAQNMKTEALQNFDCCLTSLAAYMKSNPADCYQQDIWYSWESLQYQADLLSSTGRSAEVLPNFDKWINTVRLLVPNSMLWAGASSKKAKWLSRLPTNSDKAFSLYEHIDDAIHSKEFQANLSSNLQQQSKMFVADTWLERTYLYTRRCEFQSALKAADKAKLCIDAVPNNEWASLKLAVLYQNYATINFRLGQNKTGYMYLLKSEDLLKSIPNDKTWKTELLECLSAQCRDMGKFADALRIDEYASDVGVGPMRKAHFLRHACNDAVLLGKNDLALQYGMKAIDSIDQLIESDSAWLKSGESIVFYDCFKMLSDLLIKENRTKDAEQLIHKWAEKVHKRAAKKFIDFVMYRVEARCLCRIASAKESALRAIDGELALMADPLFRDQLVWVNYFNLKWDTQMDREAVFSEYKMYPEAIAAARAALESLDNTSPEYRPDQRMESFLWMGKDYVKMGDYKEARNCFKTLEDSWNALGIEKYKIERIERIHIESLLYRDMQDYSEQKRVLELCIESKKKFYGVPVFPGHIDLNQEMEAALTKLARS